MKFTIYQESRQGKRNNNEDRIAYCYSRDAVLMVVADGMGGHYYGEIASQIAAQTLTDAFQREAKPALNDPFLFLQRSMTNAHHAILDFAADHNLKDSPRTTCVACVIQDNVAYWAHAGDSRLYLLREGRVASQTRDHSRVRMLVEQGVITEAQAANHPERNKVYSCLGGPQAPEIEFSRKTPLEAGDVVLLSTDGFWGTLPPDLIAVSLKQTNLMQAIPNLMNQAESRGGAHCDNLSVVVTRWEDNYIELAQSTVSTQTMALDEVSTKLDEFGRNPAYKMDLSDDEIEKAIQEIRSTIDKYSPKK
ncbi:MAG: serine/threonine-protein phosphatase [Betaproteobacteria bacterium]|jgi:serine/threonine protein phosphatase PrpC|uniref:Serine/threonine-protein phosphatase n=1 Tax=Candidatus Proximibacter danicus TaxID=2954365 RepID=A0A9D7PSE4_9PROT|nr:serine/threonine-protein phosphatase [Candidatus Proximibacter danicus]MBK9447000.1 serine/threonine-protein phosphatase [Betaproteobacteria bacterium]